MIAKLTEDSQRDLLRGIDWFGGGAKTQLTDIDANDTSPRFSPDGETIVFARDKTYNWGGLAANWELGGVICLIDADGSNLRQLTSDEDFAFEPYFSADGTCIVYSTVNGRMLIRVDGSSAPQPLPTPQSLNPPRSPSPPRWPWQNHLQ
jgi:Tol biopolymer transport system component